MEYRGEQSASELGDEVRRRWELIANHWDRRFGDKGNDFQ